jgi:hypothetical protein
MAMDDLAERIKASLENPNSDPWFPELTGELTAREWGRLHLDIGLTPDNYGTARVLLRSISAPRDIITSVKTSPLTDVPSISIEAVQPQWAAPYRKAGLSFYSSDEILNTTILSCVKDALGIINQIPSLMRTVNALVRSLHLIKPADADHDVSFSEPDLPFSIFVSVPRKRTHSNSLRVAEGIIHEAMHLQLTLIEKNVTLSVVSQREFFSPWKGEYRTVEGILHGLYVFSVVDRFLRVLSFIQERSAGKLSYVVSRQEQIAFQIGLIQDFQECSDLTKVGASLAKNLIRI